MAVDFKLDRAGIRQLLKSPRLAAVVNEQASDIARRVRAAVPDAEDVKVDHYTTDRAAASVTIKDVRGRLWQARDGVLTRAAAAGGLEVTEK